MSHAMPQKLILCRTPLNAYVSTLPQGREFAAWQAVLTGELNQHLGAGHASILAVPEQGAHGLEWVAVGERAVPLSMLAPEAQVALMQNLGSIFRDIEQLAESGVAPALAAAWPAMRRIPHEGFVYVVDGEPVLAAWGHAPAAASSWPDPLARLMTMAIPLFPPAPTATMESIRRRPTVPPLVLSLAAAVFLLGLILPGFGLWPFHCVLATETISLADQTNQAVLQNTQIADQQASGLAQGTTQQCVAQNLPEDDWNAGKLSMLNGCWHLTTNMILYFVSTDLPHPVATWVICFDKSGTGTQTVTFQDGAACTGPVQASFTNDHRLRIDEPTECSGKETTIVKGHWICSRTSDSEAQCVGTDDQGGGAEKGVFQR